MKPARHQFTIRRPVTSALALCLLAASPWAAAADCEAKTLPAFDAKGATGPHWVHVPLSKLKRDTVYTAAQEDGQSVLRATADRSASFQAHLLRVDPAALPMLEWRWRVPALIKSADNRDPKREDAPVRLMVAFDGDKTRLSDKEQSQFSRAKKLSGREPPYALLMYIWDNVNPVGTVITSTHSTRVKMLVAESGPGHLGSWQSYRRNLAEDYAKAFGEAPQAAIGIGLMSDTDNTGEKVEALYGGIRLGCAAR